ncbi:hypothetical protein FNF17_07160 [Escherichia coli]|uniref:Uncharacterized protein n=2 Tax=Enterobacteriaceae TaxID=543 RepID=A0A2H3M0W5_ECOLX|nr:hypothetical protein CEQ26_16740 [Escherichia coli O104:H4]ATG09138.1 hypothetical protein CO703_28220 [Escherichia coli]ECN2437206.1 hypothetical protein [Salmonella enterica subsp. enterica serovar Typhimurium]EFN7271833.1 hypothetical protein [Escherichia coli O21]EFW6889011.1 hypothetical protein [Shigella sonnei]RSF76857.1 hypothetical protein EGS97_17375 [Klebsiella pneumoniae]
MALSRVLPGWTQDDSYRIRRSGRAERGGVHTAQPRGLDLFNCVNRASPRKTLMHHLTLKVTTPKMTFNGTM